MIAISAWIVSKGLIDCLVQSLIAEGLATFADADQVGQMLWHENHLSIQARYGDEPDTPEYRFTGVEAPLDDAIVYKQIRCYGYQSCEHAAWESSEAYKLTEALATVLSDRNGGDDALWDLGEQREAPWGIEHIEQAVATSRSNSDVG